jgi:two-component system, OmpR family, alkaline phosphatase synthesis response regulator PhoP
MKKILVIEDEQAIRDALLDLLEAEGFDVVHADNGLGLARSAGPDLILCDVNLPEMNGYQVLSQLRQQSETAALPFIFLTARTAKADFRYGMELGADDYLQKPCSGEELLGAISARFAKQAAIQETLEPLAGGAGSGLAGGLASGLASGLATGFAYGASSHDGLLNFFYQELRNPLSNLNLVIHLLRNNGATLQVETLISLQENYSRELAVLQEIFKLKAQLMPEVVRLLEDCQCDRLGLLGTG